MRDTLKQLYNIEPQVLIKYSDKVYQIKCENESYSLKYVDHFNDGKVCEKLEALHIDYFTMPVKTQQRTITPTFKNKVIRLTPWIQEEYLEAKDIKLKYYLSRIGEVHNKSVFTSNVSISFYKETVASIEESQQQALHILDKMMEDIERLDYKSPSQGYYTLNYTKFIKSLEKSKEHLNKFKELTKDKSTIRQVITHQNFDYNHIFISKDKIISNEKMQICSPVYELKSLFEHSYFGSIDLSGCLKEYFNKFEWEDYELEWLFALLYIPFIKFYPGNDFKNLTNIMQSVFMVKSVDELSQEIQK